MSNRSTLTGRASNHYHQNDTPSASAPRGRKPRATRHIGKTNDFTTQIDDLFLQCRHCGLPQDVYEREGQPCESCGNRLEPPTAVQVASEWQAMNGLSDSEMVALLNRTGFIDRIKREVYKGVYEI